MNCKIVATIVAAGAVLMTGGLRGQVKGEPTPPWMAQSRGTRPAQQPAFTIEELWTKAAPAADSAWQAVRPFAAPVMRAIAWPWARMGVPLNAVNDWALAALALLAWWLQVSAVRLFLWSLPGRYAGYYDARLFNLFLRVGLVGPLWRWAFGLWIWSARWRSQINYRRAQREWMGLTRKMRFVYRPGDSVLVGTLSEGPLRLTQPVALPGIERGVAICAAPGTGKTVHLEAMIGAMHRRAAALIAPDCDGSMCRSLAPGLMRDGHRVVKLDPDNIVPEIFSGHWSLLSEIARAIETHGGGAAYPFSQVAAQALIVPDSQTQPVFCDTARIFTAGALLWTLYFEPLEHRNITRFRLRISRGLPEAARPGEHPVDAWLRVMAEKGAAMQDAHNIGVAIANAAAVMPRRGSEDGNSTNSFWSTLTYQTAWMDDGNIAAISSRSDIYGEDLKSTNTVVFLVASLTDVRKGRLAPWVRAFIMMTLYAFEKKDPEKKLKIPMTIYVDEAQNVGRIELLPIAVAGFRKYGIRVVTVWQSLQGAMRSYPDEWRDLWGLAQCMIWMGTADPATLKYLAEEILRKTTRREMVEGSSWWKFWGERIKGRYVEKEDWLMDAAQCGQTLNPITEQVIVTGMGLPPMILRRAKYYRDLPLWRHEKLPGFKENLVKSLARSVYGRMLRRAERRRAVREFLKQRGEGQSHNQIPQAATPPPEPVAEEPPPPVIHMPVEPEPPAERGGGNALDAFEMCFEPDRGGFSDAALRRRIWEAFAPRIAEGGDVHLLLWTMAERGQFTGTERNKAFKHFMAERAALRAERQRE